MHTKTDFCESCGSTDMRKPTKEDYLKFEKKDKAITAERRADEKAVFDAREAEEKAVVDAREAAEKAEKAERKAEKAAKET